MKSTLLFGAVISAVLFTTTQTFAQDEGAEKPISGFEAGLQLGYGIPLGDASQDSSMSELVSGKLPIIVDAGYRINERFYASAFVQYAPAFVADDACPSGADCSASVVRYGIEGQVHFMPREKWDPWAGFGLGLEDLGIDLSAGGVDAETSITGMEFFHLSGGADYRISEQAAVGPFVTLSLAQYSEAEVKVGSNKLSTDIDDKAIHEWLIVGVRARFNP